MALLTETGTGQGSKLGNVTVRAWIVLLVVITGCINATIITLSQVWAEWTGKTVSVQMDPVLANVIFAVVGWYFARTQNNPPK